MRYEIFKSASEIKLSKKVNEYLAQGATIVGFPQVGTEKVEDKNIQMFYQAILIPEGVVERIDLGSDDIETIIV